MDGLSVATDNHSVLSPVLTSRDKVSGKAIATSAPYT